MNKKTKTQAESPEAEQPNAETIQPAYVQELLEKGVAVIQGRSRGELDEKLAAIPSDVKYFTGAVGRSLGTGLYRIQVNIKED